MKYQHLHVETIPLSMWSIVVMRSLGAILTFPVLIRNSGNQGKGAPEMCAPVHSRMKFKQMEKCYDELSIMSNIGFPP